MAIVGRFMKRTENQSEGSSPKTVVSAVRWSGVVQSLGEGTRIIGAMILARLLLAEDFGLMALAVVVTGFIALFQYLGTSGVIVQKKELSNDLISGLFILNLTFGTILLIALQFLSPVLAAIFNMPDAGPVIRLYAISILITSFGIVPSSLLSRSLRFDLIAGVRFTETIIYSGTAITLAWLGWNVWALVYASLAGSAGSMIYLWIVSGWRPRLIFRWSEIGQVRRFALYFTGSNVVEYFARNVDRMIIGRWLGSVSLGYYSIACRLCLFPLESIAPVLVRVLFPAFSRMQEDDERLKSAFLRACGGLAFVIFPLLAGLFVLARPFVLVILGPKWEQAIPLVTLLTIFGIFKTIAIPANHMLLARGRSGLLLKFLLLSAFVLTLSMLAGLGRGIVGVAASYLIATIPLSLINILAALRVAGIRFGGFMKNLFPHLLSTSVMALSVYGMRSILEIRGASGITLLILCISTGVIAFILLNFVLRPDALFDIIRIIPLREKTAKRLLKALDKNLN